MKITKIDKLVTVKNPENNTENIEKVIIINGYKIKKLSANQLKIGELYCAKEILCGYFSIEDLKFAKHYLDNHYAMVNILPPIIINEKEDFLVLELIPCFENLTIIKFLTTNEQMGYSQYSNNDKVFYNSIELYKEENNV